MSDHHILSYSIKDPTYGIFLERRGLQNTEYDDDDDDDGDDDDED